MKKFTCTRKNFFNGRLWQPGDTASFDSQDAGAPSVAAHFAPLDGAAPAPAVEPSVVPAPEGATPVEADDGDGSTAKENLKALCLRNGIKVVVRTTMAQMRAELAAKGIVVS
jgi:hypothetical protein